ncbi:MAG: Gfo/Idh/MocA family oxidoreductase, partial [bacterium]|nr:Gfo/Idh/MocA family oxidoreductase [bacterium]
QSIRFWGAFRKIRQLVAEGRIGTPCLAQVHRMGKSGIRRVSEEPANPGKAARPWRFDTRYAGGSILESTVHELDFSRSLFGDVRSVYCDATGAEQYGDLQSPVVIQAMVNFENGGQATVRQGGIVGFPCKGSWVAGTEGTLSFDIWEGPVYHHRPGTDEPEAIECDDTYAYILELLDLLNAIESNGEPENSGLNGMKNIALGLAMYRSIELGKRLDFKNGLPVDLPMDYQYRGLNNVKE